MPRNEAKARTTVKNVGFLPLYVEDPFDSVDIQSTKAHPPPLSSVLSADIYNLARARTPVLHIFPRAANVFPREIHWQGNCMEADRANTLVAGPSGSRPGPAWLSQNRPTGE